METLNQPPSDQSTNQSGTEQSPSVSPKPSLHGKALLITFASCILLFVALTTLLMGSKTKPASQLPPSPIPPTLSHPSPTIDLSRESTGSAETAKQIGLSSRIGLIQSDLILQKHKKHKRS